ncbi:hypothetical protein KPATCC21470_5924 [Kitasatospora purpeofusca]
MCGISSARNAWGVGLVPDPRRRFCLTSSPVTQSTLSRGSAGMIHLGPRSLTQGHRRNASAGARWTRSVSEGPPRARQFPCPPGRGANPSPRLRSPFRSRTAIGAVGAMITLRGCPTLRSDAV